MNADKRLLPKSDYDFVVDANNMTTNSFSQSVYFPIIEAVNI